ECVQSVKHKRKERVRVRIRAPWNRRSMQAMSQLGYYVNRRNVQAAVSQVWPVFFGGREKISAADGRRWGQRWTHEFSIVEVPVRQQAPVEVDAKGVRDAPESCVWFPAGGSLPRCRVGDDLDGSATGHQPGHQHNGPPWPDNGIYV